MSQEGMENTHAVNESIVGEYKTIRYATHRIEMLAYQKKYHDDNRDTFLQYQKEYYQRTKEAKKERYNTLVNCTCCQKQIRRGAISGHCNTKKHLRNEATYNAVRNPIVIPDTASVKTLDTPDDHVEGEFIVYKPFRLHTTV